MSAEPATSWWSRVVRRFRLLRFRLSSTPSPEAVADQALSEADTARLWLMAQTLQLGWEGEVAVHVDLAPAEALTIVDYGDVAVEMAYIEKTMSSITTEVGAALAAGPMVVALGGDHSISLPLLRAQAAKFGPLALVHFDAHTDVEPGDYEHGTAFRHAVEEGYRLDYALTDDARIMAERVQAAHEGKVAEIDAWLTEAR